jgi:RNA polymerase sigma-70 factor, ECF subfamily
MERSLDQIFIKSLKSGDKIAFRTLVKTYQHQVLSTCYQFLKNTEDAEDTAQEVFIEVYRSIHHFKEESSLKTWIYRISINKSLDTLRRKKRKKRISQLIPILSIGKAWTETIPDNSKTAQEELETAEKFKLLEYALQKLPEKQRIAITLSKYEELTSSEISNVMNISQGAVESLIHRAKQNIKDSLLHHFNTR